MQRSVTALASICVLSLAALTACGGVSSSPDAPVTATFTLTVAAGGNGTGTTTSAPAGIDCGADCTEAYDEGTMVTLTAAPAAGSTFVGWTGGGCSGTGACTITIASDVTVTANYARDNTLMVTLAGAGTGTVTSSPAGIDCGADCSETYATGTVVTLTAAPAAGSTFTGWSGGGCTGTGTCAVTLDAAVMVTATFGLQQFTLTVVTSGNGQGVVTSAPAGITCGADCTEAYDGGTMVTLTATPSVGSSFAGWSGGGCSGTGTCTVTMSAAVAVSAAFSTNPTISVTRAGSGTGTVTSAPAGINCGVDCTEAYTLGTTVVLTATAAVGSTFTGWSGGGCSGTGTCTIGVSADATITANFTINVYTLTVAKNGNGSGTVTSAPAGITCGADCSEPYNFGTMVVLTAAPAVGSTLTAWSGGGCTGAAATCTVTIAAATTVTATFTLQQYTLTVAKAGTGTGTVTSAPAGINCGTDCSEPYNHGTSVVLTAAAAVGSTFAGWSGGGCTGAAATCTVSVTAAATVTATFNASTCDPFTSANTTTIPGWTERVGDWVIEAGRLHDTQAGSFYSHVITRDGSTQLNGCGRMTAINTGVAQVTSAGIVLRFNPPMSYVVALVQDNSSTGNFNTAWIYEFPSGSGIDGVTNGTFGLTPNLEACVSGSTITLRIDANQDGTYETTKTGTTTITTAGLTGAMVLSSTGNANPSIDNFCWGP